VKSYVGWLVAPHRDPTGVVSLDRFEARNVEHA